MMKAKIKLEEHSHNVDMNARELTIFLKTELSLFGIDEKLCRLSSLCKAINASLLTLAVLRYPARPAALIDLASSNFFAIVRHIGAKNMYDSSSSFIAGLRFIQRYLI